MKTIIFALVAIIAVGNAWPQDIGLTSDGLVADIVVTLIQEYQRTIYEGDLDPFRRDYVSGSYSSPMEDIFVATGSASEVDVLNGIANVAIHDVAFNSATRTLRFDLSYPRLHGSVGVADGQLYIIGYTLNAQGGGWMTIHELRVAGTVEFSASMAQGIQVEAIDVILSVGSIESYLFLNLFGYDVTYEINNFFGNTLPAAIKTYEREITLAIDYAGRYFLNRIL